MVSIFKVIHNVHVLVYLYIYIPAVYNVFIVCVLTFTTVVSALVVADKCLEGWTLGLSQYDRIMLQSSGWLSANHISAPHSILRQSFPETKKVLRHQVSEPLLVLLDTNSRSLLGCALNSNGKH